MTPRPNSTMAPPRPSKSNTFWTVCSRCRMQYEHLRKYINLNLLCPNCKEAFKAVEMPAPSIVFTPRPSNQQQGQNAMNANSNAPVNPPSSAAQAVKAGRAASARQAARTSRLQQGDKLKKVCEEAQAAAMKEEGLPKKFHASKKAGAGLTSGASATRSNSTRKLSSQELRNMLMKKARMDISHKLNEWRTGEL